jgi:steroid delta-isomerase-like uncharacterized protein
MSDFNKPPPYRIYLLTIWAEQTQGQAGPRRWRFSLADPYGGQRRGFTTLAALMGALQKLMVSQALDPSAVPTQPNLRVKGEDPMSTEQNKAVMYQFFEELFSAGNLSVADDIVARDYINHNPVPGETPGRAGLKAYVVYLRTAFPNLQIHLDEVLTDGDKVITRWTATGTQHGEFAGIPATGKTIRVSAINIHQVVDGQVRAGWLHWDALGLMQQLGAIPMPNQA